MRRERYSRKYFGGHRGGSSVALTERRAHAPNRDDHQGPARRPVRTGPPHLYSIEDLWIAFGRSRDYATAERLALEFGEDFRLLADIGWAADDDRKSFELTMPPLDLTELLRRLHAEADKVLVESGTEREASEDDARTDQRFQVAHDACEKVLADLDAQRDKPS